MVPTQPFTSAAADYVQGVAEWKRKITVEVIQAVRADGWVRVKATWVPVTGKVPLLAGQPIGVIWKDGAPQVAMMNQARRGGAEVMLPTPAVGLVEELFVATRPEDGVEDVYFRNFDQVVALHVDALGIVPSTVRWGPANDRFFIQTFSFVEGAKWHVMKFAREPGEAFAAGADVAGRLSRERIEVLSAKTAPVATVGGTVYTGAAPTGTYSGSGFSFTVGIGLQDAQLDDAGNLIAVWSLVIAGSVTGLSSVPGNLFQYQVAWRHTIVQDVTRGLILLDTYTSGAAQFAPLGVGDVFSGLDFADFAGAIISVPQGAGTCEYAAAIVDTTQQFDVSPILVTEAGGVHGWVGWARRQRTCAAVSLGAGTCSDCVGATGIDVAVRSGVLVQPPDADLEPLVLAPMSGSIGVTPPGLGFAPTLDRLVWRRTGASAFFPGGGLNSGGSDSPGFVTRFANGQTVQVTDTLRAAVGQRGVNILLTDFAYVLDNPATAQPAAAARNAFLNAWAFRGATTLAGVTTTSELPVDHDLDTLAVLADLPTGVAHPVDLGLYALQVVNSPEGLGAVGRYEALS